MTNYNNVFNLKEIPEELKEECIRGWLRFHNLSYMEKAAFERWYELQKLCNIECNVLAYNEEVDEYGDIFGDAEFEDLLQNFRGNKQSAYVFECTKVTLGELV